MSTAASEAVNTCSQASAWCVPDVCEWRTAGLRTGGAGWRQVFSASHGNPVIHEIMSRYACV